MNTDVMFVGMLVQLQKSGMSRLILVRNVTSQGFLHFPPFSPAAISSPAIMSPVSILYL